MFFHPSTGPIGPTGPDPAGRTTGREGPDRNPADGFEALLRQKIDQPDIRLSAHAQARLAGQGITFDASDLDRLAGAVDQAAARGSRDSLVVYRDVGLVVNIKNRTVLTALDQSRLTSGVVTGIDSTVFVQGTEKDNPNS